MKWIAWICMLLCLSCCASTDDAAQRAMYEAIAPEFLEYVAGDDHLTEDQKELRRETVAVWELMTRPRSRDPQNR